MKVGQKVVCVTDEWYLAYGPGNATIPRKDEVYTIGKVVHDPIIFSSGYGLGLIELDIRNGFDSNGFRPLTFGEEVADNLEKDFVPLELVELDSKHFGE